MSDTPRVERRPLGATGLDVPVIGMGTWRTFDVTRADEIARCRLVLDQAYATGATLFDTSPMYGASERTLSIAMGDRRRDALIADKLWTADHDEAEQQIERAMKWYGDHVDIYQVHNLLGLDRRLVRLRALQREGRVSVVGVTHYAHSSYDHILDLVKRRQVDQIQIPYNAVDRVAEKALLPAAEDAGVGVIVMRPLGEGTLVRRAPSAKELAPLEQFGVTTWAQALLKFVVSDERVSCAIPATSRPERMRENAAAGMAPWFDDDARALVARLASR